MNERLLEMTTELVVAAIAYERAPRYPGRLVNRRVVCADGFTVSVQASENHYANDMSGEAPYWNTLDGEFQTAYPFTTFEVGNPTSAPEPFSTWEEYDSGGVWAWVPSGVVADLLNRHGGAVAWEAIT